MLIQRQMSLKKAACFAVYLILCTRMAVPAEEGERSEEMLIDRLIDLLSRDVEEDMAELLWIHCRLDLIYKAYVGNHDIYHPQKLPCHDSKMNQKCGVLAKYNIQKLFHTAHTQLNQGLLDCLRDNNILRYISHKEVDFKSWCIKYLESLAPQSKYMKQNSRNKVITETTESVLDPVPANQSPHLRPMPSPESVALSPRGPKRHISEFIPPPPNSPSKSSSADSKREKKKNSSHTSVITAIVITAAVTFVFVSLLFLCCAKLSKTNCHSRKSDERPLLSLSLSDYSYSMSSSIKSFALRNSLKEKIPSQQAVNTNPVQNKKLCLDELLSLEDAAKSSSVPLGTFNDTYQISTSAMNPPPGHANLKPPPGRADPLPPEPPTLLKPSPFTANPPRAPQMEAPVRPPSSEGKPGTAPPPPPPPSGSSPVPPPPLSSGTKPGAPPPPPPKGGAPPPRPPPPGAIGSKTPRPPPFGTKKQSNTSSTQGGDSSDENDAPKTKLKPFFWDKVQATPDQAMVWNQIKAGSFQFNEEMIETLFGYAPNEKKKNEGKESSSQEQSKYIQLIDPKKAQNLSILLRALNVTKEEVCDALQEGNELPAELLQTLLKMAPTTDEELKLRLFSGKLSQLGPAERFLKALVDIPFAFKRLEALLFMCTVQEEVTIIKESFATLEVASNELRNSRLFLKLLEAVLKTGNRMNDGTFRGGAQAFKLDTLLKLSDVKGVDGKITLLHFVVQEIIRSEGFRAARAERESQSFSSLKSDDLQEDMSHDSEEHYRSLGLQAVSSLGSQLENVKKAAALDADNITGTVAKLGHGLVKTKKFLNNEMSNLEEENEFYRALKSSVESSESDVKWLLEEEKRIMALVKSTGDYFHGKAGRDEGLRIFVIVRDFLTMLDKTCKEVREASARAVKSQKKEVSTAPPSSDSRQVTAQDLRQRFLPAIANQRVDYSSSDDDDT